MHHYTKSEKSQRMFNESLVFFLVIILFIKINIMKFIGKLDNPSGEMGITHKGKPEEILLYRHRVVARSKFSNNHQ